MAEEFDAFISYSRVDRAFAEVLEHSLESFKPPSDLDVPQRSLKIFRDVSDLTGNEYFQSIDSQLRGSLKVIVVCSPAARRSGSWTTSCAGSSRLAVGSRHSHPPRRHSQQ
jgi:hypothetical protein